MKCSTWLFVLIILSSELEGARSFLVGGSNSLARRYPQSRIVSPCHDDSSLYVKKKRRRRNPMEDNVDPFTETSELPDFDLEDDEEEPKPAAKIVDGNTITPNMMSTKAAGSATLNDLLKDRSLEAKFQFDETNNNGQDLPDLVELTRGPTAPGKKKKARQAARQEATARAAAKGKQEFSNPLQNVPFLLNEAGEVSPVKILEAGAWTGIILLLVWEVYINSPLFERAAPIIPVVYDFLL